MSLQTLFCIMLAAALSAMPRALAAPSDSCAIADNTGIAIDSLVNMYYNNDTGLWDHDLGSGSEWWTSANTVDVLASYVKQMPNTAGKYNWVFENTYTKAQQQTLQSRGDQGELNYLNSKQPSPYVENGFVRPFTYYDDDGWWALAWIKVFDVTHDGRFLQSAANLFEVISNNWDDKCGGGVYWNQDKKGKNAIPNLLLMDVAAKLASRTGNKSKYSYWARRAYNWIKDSGMINDQNLIVDGLDSSTCQSNNGPV
ncbi:hypothetical protein TRVA0_011S01266 [Trichomonascus vanleenenianus]|uniref:uncharacterized protein n=1 Tax=Trichomonascus vanleenenianus TaxID=2268995 RepID=UPI003EC95909